MFWELWDKYKFYLVAGGVILLMLIIWLIFIIDSQTRVRDIKLMSEIKGVAYGLEEYWAEHGAYPTATTPPSSARHPSLEKEGMSLPKGAAYTSDGKGYEIKFKLWRKWPVVGALKKNCVVREFYKIECGG